MNILLLIGAVLAVLIGIAHSVLGERFLLVRLFRRDNLPHLLGGDAFTKQTLRFAWHLTTVAWWGFAALLVLHAGGEPDAVASAVSIIEIVFLASALMTLIVSRGRHLSWVVFMGIAAAAWFGVR
jgi:hypothetical protein